eukprot:TRINITY_DN5682_c0_g1_i12.p1 TRINITY_DN5682_c0_g1~~TRINITY_DN5682_c0_g1_i12.p1  ORF type:complete len:411 (-),score=92.69 TRINITY_DN5682_c0_g1_i12:10-1242(-)
MCIRDSYKSVSGLKVEDDKFSSQYQLNNEFNRILNEEGYATLVPFFEGNGVPSPFGFAANKGLPVPGGLGYQGNDNSGSLSLKQEYRDFGDGHYGFYHGSFEEEQFTGSQHQDLFAPQPLAVMFDAEPRSNGGSQGQYTNGFTGQEQSFSFSNGQPMGGQSRKGQAAMFAGASRDMSYATPQQQPQLRPGFGRKLDFDVVESATGRDDNLPSPHTYRSASQSRDRGSHQSHNQTSFPRPYDKQERGKYSSSKDEEGGGRSARGLRLLSSKVKEIVQQKKETTYKEVAETLIKDFNKKGGIFFFESVAGGDKNKEEQNIKRRVYDALNVLIAADVLKKRGKSVLCDERNSNRVEKFGPRPMKDIKRELKQALETVSYTHLRAHETGRNLVCRLLLEKKKRYLESDSRGCKC